MQTNSDAKGKNNDWPRVIGIGLYFGIGNQILYRILKLFVAPNLAMPTALLFLFLIAYPLFFRGNPNPWTKDKRQWTFMSYTAAMLIFAAAVFLITTFVLRLELLD
jgi:hypothetical protein